MMSAAGSASPRTKRVPGCGLSSKDLNSVKDIVVDLIDDQMVEVNTTIAMLQVTFQDQVKTMVANTDELQETFKPAIAASNDIMQTLPLKYLRVVVTGRRCYGTKPM